MSSEEKAAPVVGLNIIFDDPGPIPLGTSFDLHITIYGSYGVHTPTDLYKIDAYLGVSPEPEFMGGEENITIPSLPHQRDLSVMTAGFAGSASLSVYLCVKVNETQWDEVATYSRTVYPA